MSPFRQPWYRRSGLQLLIIAPILALAGYLGVTAGFGSLPGCDQPLGDAGQPHGQGWQNGAIVKCRGLTGL